VDREVSAAVAPVVVSSGAASAATVLRRIATAAVLAQAAPLSLRKAGG
jgi:hypothetical protein